MLNAKKSGKYNPPAAGFFLLRGWFNLHRQYRLVFARTYKTLGMWIEYNIFSAAEDSAVLEVVASKYAVLVIELF